MKILKYLPVALIPLTIICNALFETYSLFGTNSKQISDVNHILLTPAAFTFSIWGVIYLFLIIHLVWSFKHEAGKLQMLVSFAMVLNIVWLMIWHAFQVSGKDVTFNLQILILALVTIAIYCVINYLTILEFRKLQLSDKLSQLNFFGMEIHFAWLTMATLLNLSILIKFVMTNYNLLSFITPDIETILAMSFVVFVVVLTFIFVKKLKLMGFGVVATWALLGALVAQEYFTNLTLSILLGAFCCCAILVIRLVEIKTSKNLD